MSCSNIDLPYLFLNEEDLIYRNETTPKSEVDVMNEFVAFYPNLVKEGKQITDAEQESCLHTGFAMAYINCL